LHTDRVILGLAGTASITDMFFLHERGRRVGLWNLAVVFSTNITPVISGQVIVSLGWRWAFWLLAITYAMNLITTILFFPETAFTRDRTLTARSIHTDVPDQTLPGEESLSGKGVMTELNSPAEVEIGSILKVEPAWKRALGVEMVSMGTVGQALRALVSPFLLLRHPATI
jgi:MFS family permease